MRIKLRPFSYREVEDVSKGRAVDLVCGYDAFLHVRDWYKKHTHDGVPVPYVVYCTRHSKTCMPFNGGCIIRSTSIPSAQMQVRLVKTNKTILTINYGRKCG